MDLIFQKGSKESPKGHALLYFTNKDNPSEIWATYIITLPIEVDIKKYMPPFLVNDNNVENVFPLLESENKKKLLLKKMEIYINKFDVKNTGQKWIDYFLM